MEAVQATVSAPHVGGDFIDACAAPGNKTSLLCALLQGWECTWLRDPSSAGRRVNIFAVEVDTKRYRRLVSNLQRCGASHVLTMNTSFMSLDCHSSLFSHVRYFLLDPSCSGSGTYSLDSILHPRACAADSAQLQRYVDNQIAIVRHAFNFPNAHTIVYSTCSVHCCENEAVVLRTLHHANQRGFILTSVLKSWPMRGASCITVHDCIGATEDELRDLVQLYGSADGSTLNVPNAEALVRVDPGTHRTGGFFLACFQRTQLVK
uniref:Putative methyltransferase NSUN5 n=2 Tax=Lygus hesperus TaxID=30085 RepID=A0A0A9WKA5_LYGHE